MAPARKSRPTERPVSVPAMIIGMLGGMIGPIVEDAAVTAQENSASYPSFFIAGMRMAPRLAVSATAVPEIPAKIIEATMLAWASPPWMCPTSALQKRMIRSEIPPRFIRFPARMNPGIQSSTKTSIPEYIFCGITMSGMPAIQR